MCIDSYRYDTAHVSPLEEEDSDSDGVTINPETPPSNRTETMAVDPEDSPDLDVQDFRLWWEQGLPRKATEGRSRVWKLIATMLMFIGLTSIVVLALKGGGSRSPKWLPVVAAVNGTATGQSPSGGTTTASGDVAPFSKESLQSPQVVKEQSAEPKTQASLGSPPAVRAVPQEAVLSTAPPVTPRAGMSSLGAQAALPSAQSPDTKPVRTVTLRPDGAPIATPVSIESSSPADAPKPPAVSGPVATNNALGIERPVKSDSPTKYSPARSPSRVAVAKREETGPAKAADTGSQAILPETPVKPDRARTEPSSSEAATDSVPASETPGEAARQSFNRMLHTFGGLFGERSPSAVQSDSVSASAGWAVQLAAPRSETEAKSDLRRLSAQYASTLKGSKIGVRKAVVDGVTVYRLRVVDLSKADASALCARLKDDGGNCFVAR